MVHQNFWEVLPALPGPAVRFCCLAPGTRAHQHESSISRMQLDVFSLFHTVEGWDMFNKSWIPCRGFCARNLQHCQGKIRATSNRNSCSTTHTHTPSLLDAEDQHFEDFPSLFRFVSWIEPCWRKWRIASWYCFCCFALLAAWHKTNSHRFCRFSAVVQRRCVRQSTTSFRQ